DARPMQPDKGVFRPGEMIFTTAFGQAMTVLLAALDAPGQQNGNERSRRRGQQPVHPQAGRQSTTQDLLLPSTSSYARSVTRLSSLSTLCLTASSVALSVSAGTKIGFPATRTLRLEGRLIAERYQLSR